MRNIHEILLILHDHELRVPAGSNLLSVNFEGGLIRASFSELDGTSGNTKTVRIKIVKNRAQIPNQFSFVNSFLAENRVFYAFTN